VFDMRKNLADMKLPSGAVFMVPDTFTVPDTSKVSGTVKRCSAAVMAIVNCTEDSFFAGSHNQGTAEAVVRALQAEADGAAVVDFGAESTRPGARYVSEEEELRRLIPVIEGFRHKSRLPVSVDTRKAGVARRALEAGADIINDVSALEDDPLMAALCAEKKAPVILMHKKGVPANMQEAPYYEDVVGEVCQYLRGRAAYAESCGIPAGNIILDPGIGFGKRLEDNLALIAHFGRLAGSGYMTLMALSRKTFVGAITGRGVEGRLAGTLAANLLSLAAGADILRVHDVPETVDMVKVFDAVKAHL
jgi:dihydropteroate synthase